tara:strand:- start:2077 stop:2298 length:222 start_codon:yes stop_codon:yes gene_type:complete
MTWKDEIKKLTSNNKEQLEKALGLIDESEEGFRELLRDEKVTDEVKGKIISPLLDLTSARKLIYYLSIEPVKE